MSRHSVLALLLAATVAPNAYCATGDLVIYDDADENNFDHPSAICTNGSFFGETSVVHGGTAAIAIARTPDNNGAGWVAQTTYSTSSDYDGVDFWVNAGNDQTTLTTLAIYDMGDNPHFLHLEDVYGAALPANTWIQFQIPFASPFFAAALSSPPATLQTICLINHSSASGYLYFDDIAPATGRAAPGMSQKSFCGSMISRCWLMSPIYPSRWHVKQWSPFRRSREQATKRRITIRWFGIALDGIRSETEQ